MIQSQLLGTRRGNRQPSKDEHATGFRAESGEGVQSETVQRAAAGRKGEKASNRESVVALQRVSQRGCPDVANEVVGEVELLQRRVGYERYGELRGTEVSDGIVVEAQVAQPGVAQQCILGGRRPAPYPNARG